MPRSTAVPIQQPWEGRVPGWLVANPYHKFCQDLWGGDSILLIQCVFALVTTPSPVEFLASPLLSQEKERFLSGEEMLSSLILPITEQQSDLCGAPALDLSNLKNSTKAFMAGNSMSVPCVGLMLLAAALALEPIRSD